MTRYAIAVMVLAGLLLISTHARTADPPAARERVGIITTVADRSICVSGAGDPEGIGSHCLFNVISIAVGLDGSLYIVWEGRIRKITPKGISTIAGKIVNHPKAYSGDGGPASEADLGGVTGLAVGPDGSLYFAEYARHRIRKIDPDGIITTVAGNGDYGYSGDGGPATQARLRGPQDVAVGRDGSLYIADTGNHRIRKVSRNGIITTVAGNGQPGYSGDGGLPTRASLRWPEAVAVSPAGILYIADTANNRIRKVGPGSIVTVAGNGGVEPSGEGRPATEFGLATPYYIAVGPEGDLYVADHHHLRIVRVDRRGNLTTAAGNGRSGCSGDGGPANQASICWPFTFAVAQDGSLYITDTYNNCIRKVSAPWL